MEGDDPFASGGGDNLDFLASADAGGEDPFSGSGGGDDDLLSTLTSADGGGGGGDDPFGDAMSGGGTVEEPLSPQESKQPEANAGPTPLRLACL